eukprot:UN23800
MSLSTFSPTGRLTKSIKFAFLSFSNLKDLKSIHFCQKRSLNIFSSNGPHKKSGKFAFLHF